VSMTSPAAGSAFIAPAAITVSASASDTDGVVAKVSFYANGAMIGADFVAPYSINWSGVAAGNYMIHAVATDDDGATTTSGSVSITVNTGQTRINLAAPQPPHRPTVPVTHRLARLTATDVVRSGVLVAVGMTRRAVSSPTGSKLRSAARKRSMKWTCSRSRTTTRIPFLPQRR
jgi:hypothetical protein